MIRALIHCQDVFVDNGLIMPNVYNSFQYSYYMHWLLEGFALLKVQCLNESK